MPTDEMKPEIPDRDPPMADAPATPTPAAQPTEEPFSYEGPGRRRMWLMRNEQWLIYCLPFLVYMAVGMLEPAAPVKGVFEQPHGLTSFITYNLYPFIYSLKIGLTCLAIAWVSPGYRQFPFKLSGLAVAIGVVGAVLWVAINKGQQRIDHQFLTDLGLGSLTKLGARPGFNPLDQMRDHPPLAWSFLAIRFFGLVLVVPVIEEFFLRGFLMRYFIEYDWWKVPFGKATPIALAIGTGVPMLLHPQELLAAFVWFSMVTWLMVRTRNIWDCILAHGVTNLLMGLWVLYSGDWWLM
jgi:CAAX prenyl protease-like protein